MLGFSSCKVVGDSAVDHSAPLLEVILEGVAFCDANGSHCKKNSPI